MEVFLQNLSLGRRSFDDPFFEEGNKACGLYNRMSVFDIDEEELCHAISKKFSCEVPGCTSTFETLIEFEIHYNTLHRYVCSVCHKTLPSPLFLDLHIEENHDSFFSLLAERKPMYQCFVEDCKTKFKTAGERKDHCLKSHSFPPNFRWFVNSGNLPKGKGKSSKTKAKKIVDTEMKEESLDSTTAESVMEEGTESTTNKTQKKQKKSRKKTTEDYNQMDSEFEKNFNTPINSEKSDASNKIKKNPAPFRGFTPRCISANRTFYQKSHLKGREWHQNASSSTVAPSSLEGNNLSADLRDSLPTHMEES